MNHGDPLGEAPRVSVIIPHYHDLRALGLCLDSLDRQSLPRDRFEVVVADNRSPEGTDAVAGVIASRAKLVVVERKGAGPARNGGVAVSRQPILAFIDCDCIAEADWLIEGVRALQRFDVVGGRMKVLVLDEKRMTAAEAFERVFAFHNDLYVRKKDFTVTANLFCRRDVFDAVGPFRAGISEDVDWSWRARSAGYSLGYAAEAVVGHPARRTWDELQNKWRRLNAEAFAFAGVGALAKMRWGLKALALPASAIAHTPKVLSSRELFSPGQRAAALAMLYRHRLWRSVDALRLLLISNGT